MQTESTQSLLCAVRVYVGVYVLNKFALFYQKMHGFISIETIVIIVFGAMRSMPLLL